MVHDRRKADHIRINLEENVQFPTLTNGFERYRLIHDALPDLDLAAIDTKTELLGKRLDLPLLISSMTGGTEAARLINRHLAEGAQARGIAMGLGSQRTGIEQAETVDSFRVRDVAPGILLFANLEEPGALLGRIIGGMEDEHGASFKRLEDHAVAASVVERLAILCPRPLDGRVD